MGQLKKEYKLLAKKMAIKQESVKLSISDDCNGHDGDVDGNDYENKEKVLRITLKMMIKKITIITIMMMIMMMMMMIR